MAKVFITGTGRGIGFELVNIFLQKYDYEVFALSRNIDSLQDLEKKYSSRLHIMSYDLLKLLENDTELVKWIKSYTSEVDILINNAGQLVKKGFENIEYSDYMQMFNVNISAPALLIKSLLPFLKKASISHVVNITSMAGYHGSSKFPGLSCYGASKAALASLTESLASEYKETNIRFNALALGAAQTEMLAQAFPGYKAPLSAREMAEYIFQFAVNSGKYLNGKVIPVALSTP